MAEDQQIQAEPASAVPAADRKRKRRKSRAALAAQAARPLSEDARRIAAALVAPMDAILDTMQEGIVQLLRAVEHAAYERGRADGMAEAAGRMLHPLQTFVDGEPVGVPPQAGIRPCDGPPAGEVHILHHADPLAASSAMEQARQQSLYQRLRG